MICVSSLLAGVFDPMTPQVVCRGRVLNLLCTGPNIEPHTFQACHWVPTVPDVMGLTTAARLTIPSIQNGVFTAGGDFNNNVEGESVLHLPATQPTEESHFGKPLVMLIKILLSCCTPITPAGRLPKKGSLKPLVVSTGCIRMFRWHFSMTCKLRAVFWAAVSIVAPPATISQRISEW